MSSNPIIFENNNNKLLNKMSDEIVRVYAPATVANVGCGFDVLGFALNSPGDVVHIRKLDTAELKIENLTPYEIPEDPDRNTATIAVKAMLSELGSKAGFEISLEQKVKPGSGIGSSASSASAAVVGVNALLGDPFSKEQLITFAMQGERVASGSIHADNVAPCILGGFRLVRSYEPLDIISIAYPEDMCVVIVHPDLVVKTEDARRVLKDMVPLRMAIRQWGNVGALISGLASGDYDLIGRAMEDVIIEPQRANLIVGFEAVKKSKP